MDYTSIKIPDVEEGACLLYFSGLPHAHTKDQDEEKDQAVFFSYTLNSTGIEQEQYEEPEPDIDVAGSYGVCPVAELYDGRSMKLPPRPVTDPAEAKGGIRIIQFAGCDESRARDLMIATAVEDPYPPKQPPPTSELSHRSARTGLSGVPANHVPGLIFNSPNLDRRGGFTTGISLRESVRTHPQQGDLFTLFISIPHLGPAQDPAGPQGVSVDSKTLQEYRFMGTAMSPPATAPEEIVRVYQTWFLLFDNDTIGIFRSADDKLATRAPLFPFQDRRGGVRALVHMLSNSITVLEKPALIALRERASDLESDLWSSIQEERKGADAAADPAATKDEETAAEARTATARKQIESHTRSCEDMIMDLSTILRLVRYQTQKLEELLRVIQNSSKPKGWHKHARNRNPFEIGIFTQREQMMDVHGALEGMIEERERVQAQTNFLIQDLEGALLRLSQTRDRGHARDQATSTEGVLQKQAEIQKQILDSIYSTNAALEDQRRTAQKSVEAQIQRLEDISSKESNLAKLNADINDQNLKKYGEIVAVNTDKTLRSLQLLGQPVSTLSLIATIFLPLIFFCSYYNVLKESIHSASEFWRVAAPCTIVLLFPRFAFLFTSDHIIKAWLLIKQRRRFIP